MSEKEKKRFRNLYPFPFLTIIGFNPEYAEQMFVVFSRLNAKDKYEGTGVGLALYRKIVHRHGGGIYGHVEEVKGAVFHILLPIQRPAASS